MAPPSRTRERAWSNRGWSAEIVLCAPCRLRPGRQQFCGLSNELPCGWVEPFLAQRPLEAAPEPSILQPADPLPAPDHPGSVSGVIKRPAHTLHLSIFGRLDGLLGKVLDLLEQGQR